VIAQVLLSLLDAAEVGRDGFVTRMPHANNKRAEELH
jgi:hypothetical protein